MIDVDDVLTDAELDEFLGGQVLGQTTLLPAGWEDAQPARQFALGEVLRLLRRSTPSVAEDDVDPTHEALKRAVLLGAAARLYQLAISSAVDASLFYAMEKRYKAERDDEIRALAREIHESKPLTDARGRGRRSVSIVRR